MARNKVGGFIAAGIAGVVVAVMGGNALTSTSLGKVEGVIVRQWEERDCRNRDRDNRGDRNRMCDRDYNNRVRLPNGEHRTFDRERWYRQKNTGDTVVLEMRRGGFLGNIYYDPQ